VAARNARENLTCEPEVTRTFWSRKCVSAPVKGEEPIIVRTGVRAAGSQSVACPDGNVDTCRPVRQQEYLDVPDFHGAVRTAGGQALAGCRDGQAPHEPIMPANTTHLPPLSITMSAPSYTKKLVYKSPKTTKKSLFLEKNTHFQ
jgi:hypothetical protein